MKKFEINGICYEVERCTALPPCEIDEEYRADSLLITFVEDGERRQNVIYDRDMPKTAEEFAAIREDPFEWGFLCELNTIIHKAVLETVRVKQNDD